MSAASLGKGLRADMAEQPAVIERIFSRRVDIARGFANQHFPPTRGIMLVARGSSDNAAVYGRYLLELAARVPVALAAPSLYTRYGGTTRLDGWVAVALSQSGGTPEVVTTVRALSSFGARVIAITNNPESELAEAAHLVIPLECGPERAIPATKTFSASLAAVAMLARVIEPELWSDHDEQQVVDSLRSVLADASPVEDVVDDLLGAAMVSHIGRGYTFPVALEGALKYREMTGRIAEGISAQDYLHGPIAATSATTSIVAYIDGGPTAPDVQATVAAAHRLGAHVCFVTDRAAQAQEGQHLYIPFQRVEALSVIAFTARSQQIALACATRAGSDPDHPVGLHKVTLTD